MEGNPEPSAQTPLESWRVRLHRIIFEADTPAGKWFDVVLLAAILLSVLAVMLETVPSIAERHGTALRVIEWVFTGLFTVEYVLRLWCVRRPVLYARSFFGVVDLLAILPTYLSLFIPGAHELLVVRALRLLRVFRVFKLARFVTEAQALRDALLAARTKIIVFLLVVLTAVTIMGAVMHLVEGPENGFTSIPESMYWAIVTMSTVGFGDIVPVTPLGKMISAVLILFGYSMIIVPTGILSAEISRVRNLRDAKLSTQHCRGCGREGHDADAKFCKYCGHGLERDGERLEA
ncbi:MAG: ion transporter [Planctomycetota bacterium]